MGFGEEERVLRQLCTLEDEHRALDIMISEAKTSNPLLVQRLKKQKLWLKDEIARLRGVLHPDIIA